MSTEEKKTKAPRKKMINLGQLSADYEAGRNAIANAAGIGTNEVRIDGLSNILEAARADIAKAMGVSSDKLKVSVALAA